MHFVANAMSRSYGDYIAQLWAINVIVDQFDQRRLTLIVKNDMDFKVSMPRLMTVPIDRLIVLPPQKLQPSLELLNADATNPGSNVLSGADEFTRAWFDTGEHRADMFISDQMCSSHTYFNYDRVPFLRYSDEDAQECTQTLLTLGLKPDRWFATLHAREQGYESKPARLNMRDQDPRTFMPAAAHIIEKLGGQVVRLGHPAMTEFPKMDGLIDLSRFRANSFLQTFAISRSRFLLSGPSGPVVVANSLNVPVGQVNAVDVIACNKNHVYRTVKVKTADGRTLTNRAFFDSGYFKLKLMKELRNGEVMAFIVPAEEVTRMANYMFELTADTTGWREPPPPDVRPRSNKMVWPGKPDMKGHFLPDDYRPSAAIAPGP
jgi:putative glycosyltransferase (TIGR04372 family)